MPQILSLSLSIQLPQRFKNLSRYFLLGQAAGFIFAVAVAVIVVGVAFLVGHMMFGMLMQLIIKS